MLLNRVDRRGARADEAGREEGASVRGTLAWKWAAPVFQSHVFLFLSQPSLSSPLAHVLLVLQQKLLDASPVLSAHTSSFLSFRLVFRVVSILFLLLTFAFFLYRQACRSRLIYIISFT